MRPAAKRPRCMSPSALKTAPETVEPSSFRNARVPFEAAPKKPYFVVPLRVHEHVLPVYEAVELVPFDSVMDAVEGAQLTVTVPSSSSPSLSVKDFDCADDHVVESVALKWPFGWSVLWTSEPVAVADVLAKLVPVPESFSSPALSPACTSRLKRAPNSPWWRWWSPPPQASALAGSASAAAAASGRISFRIRVPPGSVNGGRRSGADSVPGRCGHERKLFIRRGHQVRQPLVRY